VLRLYEVLGLGRRLDPRFFEKTWDLGHNAGSLGSIHNSSSQDRWGLDDDGEPIVLRGRIDALVLQNRLWVILVEAKPHHEPVGFSVLQALPQTLAYMMAKPIDGLDVSYAMITNGEDYMFVKLDKSPIVKGYGQSHKFTLLSDADHNLYRVARVLKCIAQ
jgi:hypothetical protein